MSDKTKSTTKSLKAPTTGSSQRSRKKVTPRGGNGSGAIKLRTSKPVEQGPSQPTRDQVSLSRTENGASPSFTNPLMAAGWGQEANQTSKPTESAEERKAKEREVRAEAKHLIEERTGLFGLNESRLGNDVAAMSVTPSGVAVGNSILDQLNNGNKDDVSSQAVSKLSDQQLKKLASRPEGKALLRRMAGFSNSGHVSKFDGRQAARAGRFAHDKFGPMMNDNLPDAVKDAIKNSGSTHQALKDGKGPIKYDEHSVTIDKMPPGVTPEEFLKRFAKDPNKMVNDKMFTAINRFDRRSDVGEPKVGDIYDIDIFGPQNGDVILREVAPDHIDVATLNTERHGEHPEYGYRRFGFERNDDGSVDFYTRGVSRTQDILWDNGFLARQGGAVQDYDWSRLVTGIGNNIQRMGGKQRPNSVRKVLGPQ